MNHYLKLQGVLFILILLTPSLSGCGFKDIDKRIFVVSVGVDPAKNSDKKFLISLKLAVPNVQEVSNEFVIISEEGDTIAEAVRIMKAEVDKELDFSHAKLIVYNEKILKPEIDKNLYYWFIRRRDFQEMSWVTIGKPSALEVLKLKPKTERLPSNSLFLILGKDGSESTYVISEFLFDFKKRFSEKGMDPFLPIIEVKKDLFEVDKVGLLDKKGLKIKFTPKETMILNFFLNEEPKTALKIVNGEQSFVIDIQGVKTNYKIMTDNQKQPYIKVDIDLQGRIEEALFDVNNKDLRKYEKMANTYTKKQVYDVLVKLQKSKVDPIGFGLRYRSRHFEKDDWETWMRLYPEIKFKVNANVQIKDTGLIE
ncbi:Ger(x)C family spore germination protein [Neobacillus sp. CF12]|uniref:Ger(x)C family spore germination protein n=1 Tax=Neobacillus sp. CF12 TaxID=3055864 RepID=UPI0025A11E6E|nr:Ger(x)C family spore germination protein [Neobacillus sp. CF12]MDM5327324.1 Ger(x)C family spore germination protein [Neobacillus sp. CF12]